MTVNRETAQLLERVAAVFRAYENTVKTMINIFTLYLSGLYPESISVTLDYQAKPSESKC